MSPHRTRPQARSTGWLAWLVLAVIVCPAAADYADVYLADGTVMRGDVVRADAQIVLRNAAGEVRIDPQRVLRIVPLPRPATRPAASQPIATQPGAAGSGEAGEGAAVEEAPAEEVPAGLLAAPELLEDNDVTRIKMRELSLMTGAERVRIRFRRTAGQDALEDVVLAELAGRGVLTADLEQALQRGHPEEKLAAILETTGLKYADRIDVQGEPEVFITFRHRVLPVVLNGCARAGCHWGPEARVFRFPDRGRTTDRYAYTVFVILDRLSTSDGPLIDRALPAQSVLVQYLLPPDQADVTHPQVAGRTLRPVVQDTQDRLYTEIVDWIESLKDPRPDYELEYELPDWAAAEHAPEPPDQDAARVNP